MTRAELRAHIEQLLADGRVQALGQLKSAGHRVVPVKKPSARRSARSSSEPPALTRGHGEPPVFEAPVAQRTEHRFAEPVAGGSIPSGRTTSRRTRAEIHQDLEASIPLEQPAPTPPRLFGFGLGGTDRPAPDWLLKRAIARRELEQEASIVATPVAELVIHCQLCGRRTIAKGGVCARHLKSERDAATPPLLPAGPRARARRRERLTNAVNRRAENEPVSRNRSAA